MMESDVLSDPTILGRYFYATLMR